jgi:hypothetical protein
MTNIVVASKRRNGEWRGALIVDGEFQDALVNPSLADLVADSLAGVLAVEYPDGFEVALNVTIRKTGEKSGPQAA